ncbi:LrgA [Salmonella enterica subsp. enterica serovar Hillingdon]|nr:LrgA [Salmonella enterica subsp. enterica serovar Hillingdon]
MAVAISRVTPAVVQRLQVPVQVLLYAGLFIFSQYLVSWLHLPLPANLVGMVLMLALIVCRIIPLSWVRAGARWLLAEMLLFFVPAVVAVVNYAHLLRGGRLALFSSVIAISTLMVLGATAWVVDKVYRYEMSRLNRE